MIDVRRDLESGWELPSNNVPFAGVQVERALDNERLRRALLAGFVTTRRPDWVGNRKADAWLICADWRLCCPMVWDDADQLVITAVLDGSVAPMRRHVRNVPADRSVPASDVSLVFTDHALDRLGLRGGFRGDREDVRAQVERLLLKGTVSRTPPKWWDTAKAEPTDAWLSVRDVILPLRKDGGMFVAVTALKNFDHYA